MQAQVGSGTRGWGGVLLLLWQVALTTSAIALSVSTHPGVWLGGQLLLGVCMLQWFILQHDLGHRALVRSATVSAIVGHLSSLFCLLPYWPWQRVHHAHHRWTGWRTPDPTIPDKAWEDYSPGLARAIDVCWRYWIPVFAASFSLQTFWNIPRLDRLFPDAASRRRHRFSVAFIVVVFAVLIALFGATFFKVWGLAALVFMSISDPYLLSQHTHIDYLDDDARAPVPVPFAVQDQFSRTLRYPRFIERFILYSSNLHGLHHRLPQLPCYRLLDHPEQPDNDIWWTTWLKQAKAMRGLDLIFLSTRRTGVLLQGKPPTWTPPPRPAPTPAE